MYVPRLVDDEIAQLVTDLPAVLLTGPRATGKTTTALQHARTVISLDREADAAAFRADPDSALRGHREPVLLDEWQSVPGVLGAVKRAVDADPRPGRFVLTGSVRAELKDVETWPGTGRLVWVPMWGLSVREELRALPGSGLLDRLLSLGTQALGQPDDPPDLAGYVDLALRSGFPQAALLPRKQARERWLDSYLDSLFTRDAAGLLGEHRDPERLRRYFEALALSTAGVVEDKTLYDAASITKVSAKAYDRLLLNLLVTDALPAWASNRLKRLVQQPKRYVVDPALVASALRMDASGVMRSGDLLGRLLDTFVAAQLRPETVVARSRPRLYHLRTQHGRQEVDLLVEYGQGRVVALEVKATSSPGLADARHLRWLRDELGDRFVAGVVLHTGPRRFDLDDRICAAPIAALWTSAPPDPPTDPPTEPAV